MNALFSFVARARFAVLSCLFVTSFGVFAQERVAKLPTLPSGVPETTRALIAPQLEREATIRLALEEQELEEFQGEQGLYWFLSPEVKSSLIFDASKSPAEVDLRVFELDANENWVRRTAVAGTKQRDDYLEVNFPTEERAKVMIQVLPVAQVLPEEAPGNVELVLSAQKLVKPANDVWQKALEIQPNKRVQSFRADSRLTEVDEAEVALAMDENGERRQVAGRGFWWKFKSPDRGDIIIQVDDLIEGDTILGIARKAEDKPDGPPVFEEFLDDNYNGSEQAFYRLNKDDEIYIYVDSYSAMNAKAFDLNVEFFLGGIPRPLNDRVNGATELGLLFPQRIQGNAIAARPGNLEKMGLDNGERGLWWKFSPRSSGRLMLSYFGNSGRSSALLFAKKRGQPISSYKRMQESALTDVSFGFTRQEIIQAFVTPEYDYLILLKTRSQKSAGVISAEVDFTVQDAPLRNELVGGAINLGSAQEQQVFVDFSLANVGSEDWEERLKNDQVGGRDNRRNRRERQYRGLYYPENLSVWYRWTAPQSGWLRVSARYLNVAPNSSMKPEIDILEESINRKNEAMLSFLWNSNRSSGLQRDIQDRNRMFVAQPSAQSASQANSQLVFQKVEKGKNYYFRLCGANYSSFVSNTPSTALFSLALEENQAIIANDTIAQAQSISQLPYKSLFKSKLASVDDWQSEAIGFSGKEGILWWKYTAPRKQTIRVKARHVLINGLERSSGDVFLRVAQVNEQGQPSLIYSNYLERNILGNTYTYTLEEGETIYFGSGQRRGEQLLELTLKELRMDDLARNNFIENAQPLVNQKSIAKLNMINSTLDNGEPNAFVSSSGKEYQIEGSLWYALDAEDLGVMNLRMESLLDTAVEVYQLEQIVDGEQKRWPKTWAELEANSQLLAKAVSPGVTRQAINNRREGGDQFQEDSELKSSLKPGNRYLLRVMALEMDSLAYQFFYNMQNISNENLYQARLNLEIFDPPQGDSLAEPLLANQKGNNQAEMEFKFNLNVATIEDWEKALGLQGEESVWLRVEAQNESWLRIVPNSLALNVEVFDVPEAAGEFPQKVKSFPTAFSQEAEVWHSQNQTRLYRLTLKDSASREARNRRQSLKLQWKEKAENQLKPPANDNFEQAEVINQLPFESEAINVGQATLEEFEPIAMRHLSVWYRFEVPEDGNYLLSTRGSAYDTFLEIYLGDKTPEAVKRMDVEAINNDVGDSEYSRHIFKDAKAGESFLIRVTRNIPRNEDSAQKSDPELFRFISQEHLLKLSLKATAETE